MRTMRTILLVAAAALSSACADNLTCDEIERYQLARGGVRVDAPEGLSDLDPNKELQIPKASPRDPRPDSTRCLDLPPLMQTKSDG